jgi:hypothetical protein
VDALDAGHLTVVEYSGVWVVKHIALIIGVVFSTAVAASAQPSIGSVSGTLAQGQSVTISGTGFGSHPDYGGSLPILNAAFSRFEDIGCAVGTGSLSGHWKINNDSHLPNFSALTSGGRANGSCHIRKTGAVSRQGELHYDKVHNTGKGSARFWFKNNGTPGVAQGKFTRTWGDCCDFWLSTFGHSRRIGGAPGQDYVPNPTVDPEESAAGTELGNATTWNLIEQYWCSACSVAAGDPVNGDYVLARVNGKTAFAVGSNLTGTQFWSGGNLGDIGHTFDLAELLEQDGSAWFFDDPLYDPTWAGVCMGNASTWTTVTSCEWMPQTAWSASSITVLWNNGVVNDSTTQWLYVMDEHLRVNANGFALAGGSGGTAAKVLGVKVVPGG